MRYKFLVISVITASAGFLYRPASGFAQVLDTSDNFAVLGSSTVTNTGSSSVTGDLGVDPGSSITGFPPGTVDGTIYTAGAVPLQAQTDAAAAYNGLASMAFTSSLTGQDLGGLTLTPGVYTFASSAQLTGPLTLNAQGLNNAVFTFQIGSTLTTASSSSVVLINAGSNDGVFWQVGSSATLGTDTSFIGNILADQSITLDTGTDISCGRAIALNGAVTMDTDTVSNTCGTNISGYDNGLKLGPNGGVVPVTVPASCSP
jgi:hypothetical protein